MEYSADIKRDEIHIMQTTLALKTRTSSYSSFFLLCPFFICSGGTHKFSPDSWFRILKAKLTRMEINCVLDI